MCPLPDFDTTKLAEAIETLTADQLDQLPYGVIGLDQAGLVRVFNKAEAQLSGYGARQVHGKFYFADVAPCMDNGYFKGRIDKARAAGALDISFTFVGDFSDRNRELTVRVQSAEDGGIWIATKRENGGAP
jgi:photoactive yellow protein